MKPAKCPFYPDSCTVEFHPNMQHVWREIPVKAGDTITLHGIKRMEKLDGKPHVVTNITNKASERAQAWNKANRKQYNARQKTLMQARRAKRGG